MIRLLIDQGLPRGAVRLLRDSGVEAEHTGDCNMSTALDSEILEYARDNGQVVVTLDSDFHTLLALSGARRPSVVRIRIEGLKAEGLFKILMRVLEECGEELEAGVVVSVNSEKIRLRRLPIGPRSLK